MKSIISLLFYLVTLFIFAQKINPTAQKTLESVRKNYESKVSYQIRFEYELNNPKQKIKQKEIGVLYTQGEKFNLTILGVNQIFDGKKMYQISEEDQEITISKGEDEVITPTVIFEKYKKGYDVLKPTLKKNIQTIKLIPTDKKNKAKEIVLTIDASKKQLINMVEYSKDNSIISLKIISFDDKAKLNSSLFQFNKNNYKGYIITDLN